MAKRKTLSKNKKIAVDQEQQHLVQPGIREKKETPQLIALQQRVGNQAVNQMLGRQIQRKASEPQEDEVDFSNLGRGSRLPGHGNIGAAKTQNSQVPDVQKRGPFGVEAAISLTVNPPTIERRPAAEIAAAHGRPGVAGWTAPIYRFPDPSGGATNINLDFTLDFQIELAEEYTGTRGQVLQDHEQGHVHIGRRKAQEHFVDNLRTNLESQHALTRANVGAALTAAQANFVNDEESDSLAYDTADYPRMTQAYHGARTPLADLEGESGNIANMAARLRNFNRTILSGTQGQAEILAIEVISARAGLTNDELNQLQYNPEFKTLVMTAIHRADAFTEQHHYDLWLFEFSMLHATTLQILSDMRTTLDEFTWYAPV